MKLGILGYGTVASGLVDIIDSNKNKRDISIEGILVRDVSKHSHKNHSELLTSDIEDIFAKDVDVIVELLGGLHPSYEYIKRALEHKINVVTANKDMLAEFGDELVNLAKENGVTLKFEASVGGGIPVLKPLIESLEGNEIDSISAILNGTTNFILTKMYNENLSYDVALKQAQNLGFAEANPESDVMGYDAGRKLSILSTLSFGNRVYWKDFYLEGIDKVEAKDIEYAKKLDCKIKLVGNSKKKDGKVSGYIRPVLVENDNIISKIDNEFNIIVINGDFLGEVSFVGKGAGKDATGSAVYADVLDIIDNRLNNIDAFTNGKIEISKLVSDECKALVRFKKPNKDKIVDILKDKLLASNIVSEDDELAVMIDAKDEQAINDMIEEVKANSYCEDAKAILKLS